MDWTNGDRDMFEFYKQMIAIRKKNPSLKAGSFHSILCEEGVYGYARRFESDSDNVYILFNNSDGEKQLSVPLFGRGQLQSLIGGKIYVPIGVDGTEVFFNSDIQDYRAKFEMALPARCFEIIKQGGI